MIYLLVLQQHPQMNNLKNITSQFVELSEKKVGGKQKSNYYLQNHFNLEIKIKIKIK